MTPDCWLHELEKYRQASNIRRIKSQNLNVSRLALQLSLPNPLNPGVKSGMKMWLEQRPLYLSDQQFSACWGATCIRSFTVCKMQWTGTICKSLNEWNILFRFEIRKILSNIKSKAFNNFSGKTSDIHVSHLILTTMIKHHFLHARPWIPGERFTKALMTKIHPNFVMRPKVRIAVFHLARSRPAVPLAIFCPLWPWNLMDDLGKQ